jgi:hypothetical protein
MRSECSSLDAELTASQTARAQLDALAAAVGSTENAAATCTQLVVALADFVPLLDTAEALASQGTAACGTLALPEGAWRHSLFCVQAVLFAHAQFPLFPFSQRRAAGQMRGVLLCRRWRCRTWRLSMQGCIDDLSSQASPGAHIPSSSSDATGGEAIPRCCCAAQPLRTPAYT